MLLLPLLVLLLLVGGKVERAQLRHLLVLVLLVLVLVLLVVLLLVLLLLLHWERLDVRNC